MGDFPRKRRTSETHESSTELEQGSVMEAPMPMIATRTLKTETT